MTTIYYKNGICQFDLDYVNNNMLILYKPIVGLLTILLAEIMFMKFNKNNNIINNDINDNDIINNYVKAG